MPGPCKINCQFLLKVKLLIRSFGISISMSRKSCFIMSNYASRILHVNQMEQKKWLPDVVKKCMGSKIKYQFLAVQIN